MAKKRIPKKIVLGVSGSIAAYKSAEIIRRLDEKGFKVSVAMTREAEHFITPLTLSSLCGEKAFTSDITQDGASWDMPHIRLAEEADCFLVAPATANIIGNFAHGIASDLLTCIYLATKAPVLVAPAMNTDMYQHKTVQENCSKLKKLGVKFVDPVKGKLACGVTGDGHLADEMDIVNAVEKAVISKLC